MSGAFTHRLGVFPSGGAFQNWRWAFPDGETEGDGSQYIGVVEINAFEVGDEGGANLATGGTASASSVEGVGDEASRGFTSDSDAWRPTMGTAVGAWIQYDFGSAYEIGSFTARFQRLNIPITVALQSFDGSTATTVREYDTSAITSIDDIVVSGVTDPMLFREDGWIERTWRNNTTTTISSSAYATKGVVNTANTDMEIDALAFYVGPSGTETYKAMVLILDGSNVVTSVAGESSPQNLSSTAEYTFTFSTPAPVTSGERVAFVLVRTDGTSVSPCRIATVASAGESTGQITYVTFVRWDDNAPAVSDTVAVLAASNCRVLTTYRFGYVA